MTAEMKTEPGLPALVEAYRDFEPPANFKQVVETLLAYVPPKYLAGLKTIILTNSSGLSRERRRQKTWSRNRKVRLSECGGFYSQATRSSPATVSLYVDNIVRDLPRWMSRPPVLRYMVPSDVLYHVSRNRSPYSYSPQTDSRGAGGCSGGMGPQAMEPFSSQALLVSVACSLSTRVVTYVRQAK